MTQPNLDKDVVEDFGREWSEYAKSKPTENEHRRLFDAYFSIFPLELLPPESEGFDAGCGSGRWAAFFADHVGLLHCIDASEKALNVAREHLAGKSNVRFHCASVGNLPLPDGSQDFGYSVGVLHHVPDTSGGLAACVRKLKPGAPFLLYLYYRFENRPTWFAMLWRLSEYARHVICRLPFPLKRGLTTAIAAGIYWPLARLAAVAERVGLDPTNWPLSFYRKGSFRTMRNDALDRFGTKVEQRFTRSEIAEMMEKSGLRDIRFREEDPFWVAVGFRRDDT